MNTNDEIMEEILHSMTLSVFCMFYPCCYPFHTLFDSHVVSIPGCRLARSIACSAGRATTTESWRGIPSASWRPGRSETVLSARCEWIGCRNIPHISTEISTGHIGHIYRRPWNAWLLLPNIWVSCEHFLWEGSMRFDATITVDLFGRSDSLLSQKLVYSHRFHMMPWSWHISCRPQASLTPFCCLDSISLEGKPWIFDDFCFLISLVNLSTLFQHLAKAMQRLGVWISWRISGMVLGWGVTNWSSWDLRNPTSSPSNAAAWLCWFFLAACRTSSPLVIESEGAALTSSPTLKNSTILIYLK
jgi:hypothetical protein